jgi:hypothetical protein
MKQFLGTLLPQNLNMIEKFDMWADVAICFGQTQQQCLLFLQQAFDILHQFKTITLKQTSSTISSLQQLRQTDDHSTQIPHSTLLNLNPDEEFFHRFLILYSSLHTFFSLSFCYIRLILFVFVLIFS